MEFDQLRIIQSIATIVVYVILRLTARHFVLRALKKFKFSKRRRIAISKVNMVLFALLILTLLGVWGLNSSQVLVYLTSILAVIGVALFAQWSILSNVTAGIVLYFNHPLKLGDYIRIQDKDIPIEGFVDDISMYFLHIRTLEGKNYTLPNSLVLQKVLTVEYGDNIPKKLPTPEVKDTPAQADAPPETTS